MLMSIVAQENKAHRGQSRPDKVKCDHAASFDSVTSSKGKEKSERVKNLRRRGHIAQGVSMHMLMAPIQGQVVNIQISKHRNTLETQCVCKCCA